MKRIKCVSPHDWWLCRSRCLGVVGREPHAECEMMSLQTALGRHQCSPDPRAVLRLIAKHPDTGQTQLSSLQGNLPQEIESILRHRLHWA